MRLPNRAIQRHYRKRIAKRAQLDPKMGYDAIVETVGQMLRDFQDDVSHMGSPVQVLGDERADHLVALAVICGVMSPHDVPEHMKGKTHE